MKRILLVSIGLLLFACAKDVDEIKNGEEEFAVDISDSQLPYFKIEVAEVIQNEPKVPAVLKLFENKIQTLESTIGIEYRGSTSFRLSDKKSYGIEAWDASGADTDIQLLDYPQGEDFIFTGQVLNVTDNWIWDATFLHHYLGYQWFAQMGHYASRSTFVDLEINGNYMGVYLLMEKLKEDGDRIDVDDLLPNENDELNITGGYILKIDKTAGGDVAPGQPLEYYLNNWGDDAVYTQENSFRSAFDSYGQRLNSEPFGGKTSQETYFLYEYPKSDRISDAQKAYIQKYIHEFEMALLNDDFTLADRTYTDYIDAESFVDYFIINELTKNVDGYRLSTYMHKDKGGKLKMGPIWDLNIAYNIGGRVPDDDWIINYNTYQPNDLWLVHFWWNRLMEDPQFRTLLKTRWATLRASLLSDANVLGLVDQTANYLIDNGAIERNYNRWPIQSFDYNDRIDQLKNFLGNRLNWMDSEIGSF